MEARHLVSDCWARYPAVAAQLLQLLGPKDILHLSAVSPTLCSSLRFTAVPSVHLFLLMHQACPASTVDITELPVPWGRCYPIHGGGVFVLAPAGFPVPFTWTPPPPLPVGETVLVHGLTPAVGASLNGRTGSVVLWDATAQRYGVQVGCPLRPVCPWWRS